MQPTVSHLRECFIEQAGKLFWKQRPIQHFASNRACSAWNARFAGKEAGYLNRRKNGDMRWMVCLDNSMLLRYQIIWAMVRGEWVEELDHENRRPSDDRIENLRPANQSQNTANAKRSRNNSSGFKGVRWREKTQKWQAFIRVNYRNIYLGQFADPADAHQAYCLAAKIHFGEFACAG